MSNLIERMKLLNEDHAPDGWPAVRMSEINVLIEIIEMQTEYLAEANERVRELERERDKFAMEQQEKAVSFYGEKLKEIGFSGVDSYTDQVINMLRKEQAQC